MTSNSLGAKHTCAGCMTRFHDMNKEPATCPKCAQKVPVVVKATRRTRKAA